MTQGKDFAQVFAAKDITVASHTLETTRLEKQKQESRLGLSEEYRWTHRFIVQSIQGRREVFIGFLRF